MSKINWYDRGREACSEGRPCRITDARISGADRASWHAGWHHQSRINCSKSYTPEDREFFRQQTQEIITAVSSNVKVHTPIPASASDETEVKP